MASFRRLTEVVPEDPGPWIELGVLTHFLGDYAASVRSLERARELDPEYFARRPFEVSVLEASRAGRQVSR